MLDCGKSNLTHWVCLPILPYGLSGFVAAGRVVLLWEAGRRLTAAQMARPEMVDRDGEEIDF